MNFREAKELVKHEIRATGTKISSVDPRSIDRAARTLMDQHKTQPDVVFLHTTPTGKIKYGLRQINPGERWRYIDVNTQSIINFINYRWWLNLHFEKISPTEIIVGRGL